MMACLVFLFSSGRTFHIALGCCQGMKKLPYKVVEWQIAYQESAQLVLELT